MSLEEEVTALKRIANFHCPEVSGEQTEGTVKFYTWCCPFDGQKYTASNWYNIAFCKGDVLGGPGDIFVGWAQEEQIVYDARSRGYRLRTKSPITVEGIHKDDIPEETFSDIDLGTRYVLERVIKRSTG